MKKVKLFIAMSLDGYIADNNGGVNWLEGDGSDNDAMDSYSAFVKDIDTIIMGMNTYKQIVTELSPNNWVYDDFKTYVVTHNKLHNLENISFTDENPIELVKRLRQESGKDIWICGGAMIINELIKANIIDLYHITIIPTLLGSGIKLFDKQDAEIKLKLERVHSYNGMVDLIYTKRDKS